MKAKTDEPDDEDYEFGTNPFFKLLALIFSSAKEPDIKAYSQQWASVIKEKHSKIEDANELWGEIKDEIGDRAG